MIKNYIVLMFAVLFILCGCSNDGDKKTINIAVTGSPEVYSEYYEKGIKKAYADVLEEYKDENFNIKCEFYDDHDDYAKAEIITAKLVDDASITAIIASSSEEICENQAYQTDKAGKILVCPHWMYDDTLSDGNYDKVFGLNNSSERIGYIMKNVAAISAAKKWVICYSDDKISRAEIKEFNSNKVFDVVDCVKINELMFNFNKVVDRWKLLGVEGVVLVPNDNEGFELLYKLKEVMPELYVVGDSTLDDSDKVNKNKDSFSGVYIVDSFYINEGGSDVFSSDEYIDTWEIHGYNTLRMIVDTAINLNTDDPDEIAKALHRDGYSGELENFKFDENGMLLTDKASFIKFTDEGPVGGIFVENEVE